MVFAKNTILSSLKFIKKIIVFFIRMPREMFYKIWFGFHGVNYKKVYTIGLPQIQVKKKGIIILEGMLYMCNIASKATLGINRRCKLLVYHNATLHLNGKISMSNTTIVATKRVVIGNNVMIGGGCVIVDSDFHSMDYNHWHTIKDEANMKSKDVIIGNNVFIGMNSIILKGVIIGDNVIIGAGSVVRKSIPSNEVWAGNPAVFIKKRE